MKVECDECSMVYGFPAFIDFEKDTYVASFDDEEKRTYYHIWCYMALANLTELKSQ